MAPHYLLVLVFLNLILLVQYMASTVKQNNKEYNYYTITVHYTNVIQKKSKWLIRICIPIGESLFER